MAQNKLTVGQNRRLVYIAVKTLKFLATEKTALLGHSFHNGKSMHLFEEFTEFDSCTASYLYHLKEIREQETQKKPEVNLLSSFNVRRLLLAMRTLTCASHMQ